MAELMNVAIDSIRENMDAIRAVNRQGEEYLGLVDSIKNKGFLGTITVRPLVEGDKTFYVVVDGMHRYMASKDAGLTEIPCNIATLDEAAAVEFSIMGNVHRKETKASEYRVGLLKLLNLNPMMTEADLATKLGKSTTWVQNVLRLNKIESKEVMDLVDSGAINISNAYALAKLPADEQLNFLTEAQTMKPEEFVPLVTERVNEIKASKRKGEDPSKAEFTPVEWVQKTGDIKAQRDSGEVADALIAETGVSTAKEGFILALNWVMHADVFSIQEQRTKWEAKEAEKAEKARQKEAERAAKKKAQKEEELKKAVAAEAMALEAAGK